MPKKLSLTALKDGRWRKMYHGKLIFFPKSDYKSALHAWERRKVAIDNAEMDEQNSKHELQQALAEATPITGYDPAPVPATVAQAMAKGIKVSRFASGTSSAKPTIKNSVGEVAGHFIKTIEASYKAGMLSASRFKDIERQTKRFVEFVGADISMDEINSIVWTNFVSHLKGKIAGGIAIATAGLWKIGAKQFLKFAVENEFMENYPKNFQSSSLRFTIPPTEIKTFTPEEFINLLQGTAEKTQLYLLLMANTGMLQTDIANLKHCECDWKNGRITRKRSKTKKNPRTPLVSWKLWPKTIQLLKKFRSNDPERVLINENGKPLVFSTVVDGELKRCDNIRLAYMRVCKRLQIKPKLLKLLRKTGATALANHKDFATLDSLWLGHAPNTQAGQAYSGVDFKRLDDAVDYLEEFYKIALL